MKNYERVQNYAISYIKTCQWKTNFAKNMQVKIVRGWLQNCIPIDKHNNNLKFV